MKSEAEGEGEAAVSCLVLSGLVGFDGMFVCQFAAAVGGMTPWVPSELGDVGATNKSQRHCKSENILPTIEDRYQHQFHS